MTLDSEEMRLDSEEMRLDSDEMSEHLEAVSELLAATRLDSTMNSTRDPKRRVFLSSQEDTSKLFLSTNLVARSILYLIGVGRCSTNRFHGADAVATMQGAFYERSIT